LGKQDQNISIIGLMLSLLSLMDQQIQVTDLVDVSCQADAIKLSVGQE
jgi:hypothetical protein